MSLLTANKLGKFYGADEILSDISIAIPAGARIALVGPNGAGKTTLINILAGIDLATSGAVHVARDARISFLPQRPELAGEHSLWDEHLKAFAGLREIESRLARLEQQMADVNTAAEALEAYGPLQAEFERRGGYSYETRIKMVLGGLGFSAAEYAMPLPQLSGGQRTRALLGRLLLEEPDLLILDEPTNHLDISAVEWLEKFLETFSGAVLAVSHDRYFIDRFASAVWKSSTGNCNRIAAITALIGRSAPSGANRCGESLTRSKNSSARSANSSAVTWAAVALPKPKDGSRSWARWRSAAQSWRAAPVSGAKWPSKWAATSAAATR